MTRDYRRAVSARAAAVAAAALVATLLPTSVGAGQSLDDVVRERQLLEEDVSSALADLERLEGEQAGLQMELADLERDRGSLSAAAAEVREELNDRVRAHFKRAEISVYAALVSGESPAAGAERAALLGTLHRRDAGQLEDHAARQTQLDQLEALLAARRDELASVESELAARTAEVQAALDSARRREGAVRSRLARQKTISRGPQQGTYSCIFDPGAYSFIDSWGFARSGGRRHKGADVMAPRGVNVYAFTSGTVGRMTNGGLGGLSIRLRGSDGNRYYYAHLDGFADGISSGVRVQAGDLLGFNGDSGNARGGPTHVHFQLHPGGGAPTNPYPWLRAACP